MEGGGQILQIEGDHVRRQIARRRFDDFRKFAQLCRQRQFIRAVEPRQVDPVERSFIAVPLHQYRADAGVRILDVIDGVFVGLAGGQIEIEIQMLVGFAQHVEKTAGVVADLGAQCAQSDEFAGARRHLRLLSVAVQHGELHECDIELARIEAERLQGTLDAWDIAVMIGAPDIDHAVKTTLVFVQVIGDI